MLKSLSIFTTVLVLSAAVNAAIKQDVEIARSQLTKAEERLDSAQKRLAAAEKEATKHRAATKKAEREVKALRQLLLVYGEAVRIDENNKQVADRSKMLRDIHRALQDAWRIPFEV